MKLYACRCFIVSPVTTDELSKEDIDTNQLCCIGTSNLKRAKQKEIISVMKEILELVTFWRALLLPVTIYSVAEHLLYLCIRALCDCLGNFVSS